MTDNIEILAEILEKRPGLTTRQLASHFLKDSRDMLQTLRYWEGLGRLYSQGDGSKPLRWFLSSKFVFERAIHEAIEAPEPPRWVEQYAAGRRLGLSREEAWTLAKRELVVKPAEGGVSTTTH